MESGQQKEDEKMRGEMKSSVEEGAERMGTFKEDQECNLSDSDMKEGERYDGMLPSDRADVEEKEKQRCVNECENTKERMRNEELSRSLRGLSTGEIAQRTRNHSPFSDCPGRPRRKTSSVGERKEQHPQLLVLVDQITTLESLRTSKDVVKLLQKVIDECVAPILVECWRMQSIKPRLDAMMKLAVPFLCTPVMTSMLNIGESLSNSNATLDRVKKCIVDIFTFFINFELATLKKWEDSGLDKDRVELCIALLCSKCSKYSPLALTLREYSHSLLKGLSLHSLGVTALCEDIMEAISSLVHQLGVVVLNPNVAHSSHPFDSNALSTQRGVLDQLAPYILDYFAWLESHRSPFVKMCRSIEVIANIHPALRQSLKNEDFYSPQDIIRKYEDKYKPHLTLMTMPIQRFQREDITQATKDIVREDFIVNSVSYHGSHVLEVMLGCLKSALRELETQDKCTNLVSKNASKRSGPDKEQDKSKKELTLEKSIDKTEDPQQYCSLADFAELMSRFLLIASSRTLSSGDAFFVLNELFGGEGLTLTSKTRKVERREADVIKMEIGPLNMSVESSQSYDLFSTTQLSQCKDPKNLVPIISFKIKVFTVFKFGALLRDFLSLSSSKSNDSRQSAESDRRFQNSLYSYFFIILSSNPERICRRSLTIAPCIS